MLYFDTIGACLKTRFFFNFFFNNKESNEMNTFSLNAQAIQTISLTSSDAVKKTALSTIQKNLRGQLSEADNCVSLEIPTGTVTASYRDGSKREFSAAMPILKLLSIDKGNLSALIDSFETGIILKGCGSIPELAYKEVTEKTSKKEKVEVKVTVEDILLQCVKAHFDLKIKSLQDSYKAILDNANLQDSYLQAVKKDSALYIQGEDVPITMLVDFLVREELQEKIEQIESAFGSFRFTQVNITSEACSYKLESFDETGKTAIIERLTPFGFKADNVKFKSESCTKDSREMMELFSFDLITVKF